MSRISKLMVSVFMVIGLIGISILPASAYSYTTTKVYYNSSNGNYFFYSPGSYSTKYGAYRPTTPAPPVVKPPVVPPQPSVPPTKPPVPQTPPTPAPGSGLTGEESKMVNLVNQERMGNGLKPFGVNMQLVNLARMKSQDMAKNNYFSHTSPTYGSPFDMMHKAGVQFKTAGENIAGAATTESAHQSLMNSPGHRANILNPSFNQIGIGIFQGSMYGNMFTQMFIGN